MATNPGNRSLSSSSEAIAASDLDSDMSADEGGSSASSAVGTSSAAATEHKQQENRISSLQQANRVLKVELEMYKLRCKQMQEVGGISKSDISIVFSCRGLNYFWWNEFVLKHDCYCVLLGQ